MRLCFHDILHICTERLILPKYCGTIRYKTLAVFLSTMNCKFVLKFESVKKSLPLVLIRVIRASFSSGCRFQIGIRRERSVSTVNGFVFLKEMS